MVQLKAHVFVCTNERPEGSPRGCCKAKKSDQLIQLLRSQLASHGVAHEVRVQKAGCLDVCEHGPALVIYPDAIWYGSVQPSDVPEIVQAWVSKQGPVQRLLIPGK
ncbi:MAG: (2Fe-2S) ferredoxin domain-containing protein [Bdellovibrionia bacterium]